jgi:hypothetical protein
MTSFSYFNLAWQLQKVNEGVEFPQYSRIHPSVFIYFFGDEAAQSPGLRQARISIIRYETAVKQEIPGLSLYLCRSSRYA